MRLILLIILNIYEFIYFFNNRFFIFKELLNKKLQLLECKPAEEIITKEDFDNLIIYCTDMIFLHSNFTEREDIRTSAAKIINDPELFIKEEEKPVIELDMNYKDTLIESNREPADPVMDNLICKALETVALQGYKHFTKKDIGFRYSCVDGLKVQHNIQDKQRIGLIEKRLQFFREQQEKQQLNQQLNHIQNAGNNMEFQNERLHA